MGMVKREMVLGLMLFMVAVCGFCEGIVYKVGDSAGWTFTANVDYKKWASSKTFQVGDTLIFEYDPRYHNVLEVSRSHFHTCDGTAPITTHTTGNDSIAIRSPGHYYYICSFMGHCQAGQNVDIRVLRTHQPAAGPIPSPTQAPHGSSVPKASLIGPLAPSPSPSGGHSLGLFPLNVGLLLIVVWVFNLMNFLV